LRTKGLAVGYPGNVLFEAEDIELHRQEVAALIGPNGSGKSTFLKTILEQLPPLAGEIKLGASLSLAYFAQAHETLHPENTVLDELLNRENMPISEARNYLALFLFRGDDVYKRVSMLSGGERGRLSLALLSLEKANFLLLDEPTNHLDIPAQETLQEAMAHYGGTILMVSHDRYLVNRLATQVWEVASADAVGSADAAGRLRVYAGNYQAYLAVRQQENEAAKEAAQAARPIQPVAGSPQNGATLSKNEQRRLDEQVASLESHIEKAEQELQRLITDLQEATEAQSFDKIQSLSVAYAQAESNLNVLMAQWEKLHE
jgi:ATP-binding cassette subfamily F protein 3